MNPKTGGGTGSNQYATKPGGPHRPSHSRAETVELAQSALGSAPTAKKPVERFVDRLQDECGLDLGDAWEFHRTYAGRVQREQGAWSWFILTADRKEIGGYLPINELLKAERLDVHREQHHQALCVDVAADSPTGT